MVSGQMGSIEKRVANAILSMIRARRKASAVLEEDVRLPFSVPVPRVKLREAAFSDFMAVAKLKERWGLAPDSAQNWERLWRANPACGKTQVEHPIGWVLEAEREIVGYLGNISLLYRYGDRTLTAVAGHGLVVEPAYRAVSLTLSAAFYRQKAVDLYLTTTAIEATGKIARAFKSEPLPQTDYETVLFWVLQPYAFAQALMKKLGVGPALSKMGSLVAAAAVGTDTILRRRRPRLSSGSFMVKEIGVHEIGDEFQALWTQRLNERPQLLADRSPAVLRWHFAIPGDTGSARVLCCHNNGELLGYAVFRDEPPNRVSGMRRSILADMLAKHDDPAVLSALWVAAYKHAKKAGSHIFEVSGFPQNVRRVCSEWNPYRRKHPSCPFYYKAADPMLHKTFSDEMAWYASPFDGDTTLIPPA